MNQCSKYRQAISRIFFYEMADIQNYLFIKYKDEYQKSKWTIECRIFISFIWSRSELWKCYNDNVFTKKLIFATYIGMSRFPQPYSNIFVFSKKNCNYHDLRTGTGLKSKACNLWFYWGIHKFSNSSIFEI